MTESPLHPWQLHLDDLLNAIREKSWLKREILGSHDADDPPDADAPFDSIYSFFLAIPEKAKTFGDTIAEQLQTTGNIAPTRLLNHGHNLYVCNGLGDALREMGVKLADKEIIHSGHGFSVLLDQYKRRQQRYTAVQQGEIISHSFAAQYLRAAIAVAEYAVENIRDIRKMVEGVTTKMISSNDEVLGQGCNIPYLFKHWDSSDSGGAAELFLEPDDSRALAQAVYADLHFTFDEARNAYTLYRSLPLPTSKSPNPPSLNE